MNRSKYSFNRLLISVFCILLAFTAISQSKNANGSLFRIEDVEVNEETNRLNVSVKMFKNYAHPDLDQDDITVSEDGKVSEKGLYQYYETIDKNDTLVLMFLIDISGSMAANNRFNSALDATKNVVINSELPDVSKIYISTFSDKLSDPEQVGEGTVDYVLNDLRNKGVQGNTDLNYSVIESIKRLQKEPATKRALIILSDGEDDIRNNPRYREYGGTEEHRSQNDVFKVISELDSNFYLFPVGLGDGADHEFLTNIAVTSPYDLDIYTQTSSDKLSEDFDRVFTGISKKFILDVYPLKEVYTGNDRSLTLTWNSEGLSDTYVYSSGSPNYPTDLRATETKLNQYLIYFLIGVAILAGLIGIFSLFLPWFHARQFKKNHVIKYKQEGNLTKRDPVTDEPFREGELIVNKCAQLISLETWEGVGNQCPNYPDCMNYLGCSGNGAKESHDKFFSQKGSLKKLNWLWFGGVGGFISWILFAIYQLGEFSGYKSLVSRVVSKLSSFERGTDDFDTLVTNAANETMVGICLAAGLITAISFVEEFGQSRKFSLGRILLRLGLGLVAAYLVFMGGALLLPAIPSLGAIKASFITGILTWLMFGVVFGIILSLKSSISPPKGILGSVLAFAIGYLIYYLLTELAAIAVSMSSSNFLDLLFFKLLSFILIGCILGYIIVIVISRLEDFELVCVSPEAHSGTVVPISKWLKTGMTVWVGSHSKCHVLIKWHDEAVADRHAKLMYEEDTVFIEPETDVLKNGTMIPIKQKTILKDKDIIQLGRDGITQYQYNERRSNSNANT